VTHNTQHTIHNTLIVVLFFTVNFSTPFSVEAQTNNNGSGTSVTDVGSIPPITHLGTYINSQAPILFTTFCVDNSAELWIFQLESSPLTDAPVDGSHGDVDLATWHTFYFYTYNWIADGLDPTKAAELEALNAEAALMIGDLEGPCGTSHTVALYFSIDDGVGSRLYYMIPLVEATTFLYDTAVTASPAMHDRSSYQNPCDSDTYCDDTYRGRLKDGLDGFVQCMSSSVPPVSLWNVACFVGCAPLLAGTPIAYAACAAACNAGVSGAGIINYSTCESQLQADKDNALQSYCSCLSYKEENCPGMTEVDIHGCP